ncbi:endoglucanase [Treponema rectale]|nr:glycoside hydrolase family 5 protein [Treponema rectale]MBB5219140.1 endoglucanase [Treponema rectale]
MKKKTALIKTLLTVSSAIVLSACLGNAEPQQESSKLPEDTPVSSSTTSIQFAKKMQAGWNLGNTFDAQSEGSKENKGVSTETSWGMPYTTQSMIKAVAAKGFKTIRIPVSWHNHITDSNLTIDPQWLSRIKTVTDYAINEGMYVIINIHHDNLTSAKLSTTYGYTVNTNTAEQETSRKYITAVWKQVAEYFKEYNQNLIFELLNEPRNRDSANDGFTAPENISDLNKVISSYNQAALNAIRASGSKNTDRFIMVPYYAASPYDSVNWTVPNDSAADKLLIAVHAYCPYDFCMNTTADSTFEDDDEGNDISYLFSLLKSQWVSKGYGVVMGEASASDKNNTAERLKWVKYYYKKAKQSSVPVILWDNMNISTASGGYGDINSGECHGYFNRKNCSWWFEPLIDEMISISK